MILMHLQTNFYWFFHFYRNERRERDRRFSFQKPEWDICIIKDCRHIIIGIYTQSFSCARSLQIKALVVWLCLCKRIKKNKNLSEILFEFNHVDINSDCCWCVWPAFLFKQKKRKFRHLIFYVNKIYLHACGAVTKKRNSNR